VLARGRIQKSQLLPWGTTPDPLKRWVESFGGDGDWELATKLRDRYTHRTTTRHITIDVGSPLGAQAHLEVDGKRYASTQVMNNIADFGLVRFRTFADAVDHV
jgi:hypothetical protein